MLQWLEILNGCAQPTGDTITAEGAQIKSLSYNPPGGGCIGVESDLCFDSGKSVVLNEPNKILITDNSGVLIGATNSSWNNSNGNIITNSNGLTITGSTNCYIYGTDDSTISNSIKTIFINTNSCSADISIGNEIVASDIISVSESAGCNIRQSTACNVVKGLLSNIIQSSGSTLENTVLDPNFKYCNIYSSENSIITDSIFCNINQSFDCGITSSQRCNIINSFALTVNGCALLTMINSDNSKSTNSSRNFIIGNNIENNSANNTFLMNVSTSGATIYNSRPGCVKIATDTMLITDSNGSDASDSAILSLESIDRGFLPPRMTTTQIGNIATPAEGLIVYDTTTFALNIYSNGTWRTVSFDP